MAPQTRSTAYKAPTAVDEPVSDVEQEEEEDEESEESDEEEEGGVGVPFLDDIELNPATNDPLPFTSAHTRKVEEENNFPPGSLAEAYRLAFGHSVDLVIKNLRDELAAAEEMKSKGEWPKKTHFGLAVPAKVPKIATKGDLKQPAEELGDFTDSEDDDDDDDEDDDAEMEEILTTRPRGRFDYPVPPASVYGNPTSRGTWNHPSSLRPAYQPSVQAPPYRSGFYQPNVGAGPALPTPLSARSPLFGDAPRPDRTTLGRGRPDAAPPVASNAAGGLFSSRPPTTSYPSSFNGGGGNGLFATNPRFTGAATRNVNRPTAAGRSYVDEFEDLDLETILAIREARRARNGDYGWGSRARFTFPFFNKNKNKNKNKTAAAPERKAEPGRITELKRSGALRRDSVERPHLKGSAREPTVKRSNATHVNHENRPRPGEVRFRNPDGVRRKPAVRYKDSDRPRYYVN
ncbi:hypothetical protein BST61_g4082 [Cercospora zeina]